MTTQHIVQAMITLLLGIVAIAPLIAWTPAILTWLRQPLSSPILVLAGTSANGQEEDVLLTQAALPAIIDHDPQRRNHPRKLPRRKVWLTAALAILCVAVISGTALITLGHDTPAPQVTSYLYVQPGHQVIFIEVQGALQNTTGTWIEADRTAKGVTRHQWTFTYSANSTTVHMVLTTNTGTVAINGTIDDAQYRAMDLTLPPGPTGLIPPPAHFKAASYQDWNSAYTALVAGTSH